MNSEQYENLIALLKKALEFYADQRNYDGPMGNIAPIALDEYGSQARFTLKAVKEQLDQNQKLQEDYDKVINETISAIENHPINIDSLIKTYKDDRNV
jgi:hypothetical protein